MQFVFYNYRVNAFIKSLTPILLFTFFSIAPLPKFFFQSCRTRFVFILIVIAPGHKIDTCAACPNDESTVETADIADETVGGIYSSRK